MRGGESEREREEKGYDNGTVSEMGDYLRDKK
jgi:hypothetical protein